MASTISSFTLRTFPPRCVLNANTNRPTKQAPMALPGRRQLISLLTATTALKALEMPSKAEDIGLFGMRKKLNKVEEGAKELVKEGFKEAEKGIVAAEKGIEAAGKGLVAAEKGIEAAAEEGFVTAEKGIEAAVEEGLVTVEKGIEAAEETIESAMSFGGSAQAGVVAGAELVGFLVASTVVNGILGPEAQKS